MGVSTLQIAEGLKENGFGKVISLEYDAKVYAKAKERVENSGLGDWIELRNGSSLEASIKGKLTCCSATATHHFESRKSGAICRR